MFTRIVKMEFKEAEIPAFLANFELIKDKIRSFPGCCFLELYRDKNVPEIFFTYSKWEDEKDLENYRNSALFNEVWATTKIKFRSKAQAWSVDTLHKLN
ncbi:MAG: antibiotic biosynthesis monooxygenase [Bacteroidia bacterium]|nr:antibiotic biosynthesis monooxygenase [Bacteroidia bacterium]MBT8276537.1 antibiotic biosynthesis monooxygenase [Bacteroidia bacterium]NNF30485.1 antibiotic biosynthesis monooxygenase [Flavobacteriaceae bacterium]NNJ82503.1 antibiotic biosynthesis monooxygenase [Flavobacteriaceae bacterium]NNK53867.1 antibiotic biosynthesis monooxygenase [Flavobacteriaceae bacterium]